MRFLGGHEGALKGMLYWDGAGFGILNSSGNWGVRFEYGNANCELYNIAYANDIRPYVMYDRNDTAYYVDPSSTSNLNYLNLGGRNMRQFEANSYCEFYVGGDANTYYPVLLNVLSLAHWGRWSISRGFADTAPWDPIGTGVHHGGLTLTWEWSGDGAWGGNDHAYRVVEFSEQYTSMCAGMQLTVSGMVVWLRGGNAYYRLHGPGGMTNSVTVYLSGFTAANGSVISVRSDTSNVNGEINVRYPIRYSGGVGELFCSNTRVLHEDVWINNKYFGSDGHIYTNASLRGPIYYDTNDTAYYVDPNGNSTLAGNIYLGGKLSFVGTGASVRIHLAGGSPDWSNTGIAAAWNVHSDYRLKENISPLTGALQKVMALEPITFTWIGEAGKPETAGFLAHKMAEQAPYAVMGQKDAINQDGSVNPQSADYSKLVPLLAAAIQEQQQAINALTEKINSLMLG